jgi:hypothetical protein
MKLAKNETKPAVQTTKVQLDLEKEVAIHLDAMESHTKISKSELANIALKRFISAHKDYFPDDYFSSK